MSARVLHLAASKEASSGIVYQMESESLAAKKLGLPWETHLLVLRAAEGHKNSPVVSLLPCPKWMVGNPVLDWICLRLGLLRFLIKMHQSYDAILWRYLPHDPLQTLAYLFLGRKILSVHHTKEIEERSGNRVADKIRAGLEKRLGRLTLSLNGGVVAVTNEILDYEISRAARPPALACLYSNGVLYGDREIDDDRGDVPTFLFVASEFHGWHGLDLLIEAARECEDSFVIDLVGHVSDSLARSLARDPRFVLHGTLPNIEIRNLASRTWAGLSSFALYRQQMTQASTLKVREYLEWGLPVIADYEEVFPDEFRYYQRSAADFKSLLDIARNLRQVSRSEVRQAAEPYISKVVLLDRLARELEGHLGSQY